MLQPATAALRSALARMFCSQNNVRMPSVIVWRVLAVVAPFVNYSLPVTLFWIRELQLFCKQAEPGSAGDQHRASGGFDRRFLP
jgi:hypothetical protein